MQPRAGQPTGDGHPLPMTPFREKLWQMVSTPLGRMVWIIHRTLLFRSSLVLILQVKSGSALGPYLSQNCFCSFWSAKTDIAGLGLCCTFCSQGACQLPMAALCPQCSGTAGSAACVRLARSPPGSQQREDHCSTPGAAGL